MPIYETRSMHHQTMLGDGAEESGNRKLLLLINTAGRSFWLSIGNQGSIEVQ